MDGRWGASVWVAAAVALSLSSGCADKNPAPLVPPLGPQPEVQLGSRGAVNATPSVASHGSTVVVAWTAARGGVADLYAATSQDAGQNFSAPARVNDVPGDVQVCSGDPPKVLFGRTDDDGKASAAQFRVTWRSRLRGERRAAGTSDAGRTFLASSPVGADGGGNAGADGCSKERVAVVTDPKGTVHVVRRAEGDGSESPGGLVYAALQGGKRLGSEQPIETLGLAAPAHPDMAFDEFAMLVLVWDEAKGGVTRIAMRRLLLQPGGDIGNAGLDVLGREVPSSHPAVTRIPGGVLVAWTEAADTGSLIGVQRVGLDMVCSVGTSEAR